MTDLRKQVEEAAQKASPRPWSVGEHAGFEHVVYADHAGVCRCDNNPRRAFSNEGKNVSDAAFIVALVNAYHNGDLVWREEASALDELTAQADTDRQSDAYHDEMARLTATSPAPTVEAVREPLRRIESDDYHSPLGHYDYATRQRDLATLEATIKQQAQELRVVNLNEQRIIAECDAAHRKARDLQAALARSEAVVEAYGDVSHFLKSGLTLTMHKSGEAGSITIGDNISRRIVAALSALDTGKEG